MGQAISISQRQRVAPQSVTKLMGIVGPTQAAARLGVSTTLLHKAKKEGAINRVVETAAVTVLEHLGDVENVAPMPRPRAIRGSDAMFLIAVPRDKADIVQKMAAALGAELVSA